MVVDVPQTFKVSAVMRLVVMGATVILTVSLHVLMPLLTVAMYEVVAVGVTEMDGVVAPVDQRNVGVVEIESMINPAVLFPVQDMNQLSCTILGLTQNSKVIFEVGMD